MGRVVEEFGKREGVSDQRSTDAVSNPIRHRQAGRIVRDGLNQATPFTLGKAKRRPRRNRGVQDVFERQTLAAYLDGELCGTVKMDCPVFRRHRPRAMAKAECSSSTTPSIFCISTAVMSPHCR